MQAERVKRQKSKWDNEGVVRTASNSPNQFLLLWHWVRQHFLQVLFPLKPLLGDILANGSWAEVSTHPSLAHKNLQWISSMVPPFSRVGYSDDPSGNPGALWIEGRPPKWLLGTQSSLPLANSGHWTPSKTTSLDEPYSFLLHWSQIHVEFQSSSSGRQSPHLCEASHSTPPQSPPTGYPPYHVWKVTTLPTFSAGIHIGT